MIPRRAARSGASPTTPRTTGCRASRPTARACCSPPSAPATGRSGRSRRGAAGAPGARQRLHRMAGGRCRPTAGGWRSSPTSRAPRALWVMDLAERQGAAAGAPRPQRDPGQPQLEPGRRAASCSRRTGGSATRSTWWTSPTARRSACRRCIGGGCEPRFSPDGRTVVYVSRGHLGGTSRARASTTCADRRGEGARGLARPQLRPRAIRRTAPRSPSVRT